LICCAAYVQAQDIAVGTWRAHLPFKNINSITSNGNQIIAGTKGGVMYYNIDDGSIQRLTTVEGLSEITVNEILYIESKDVVAVAYNNLDIDLIQNGQIKNIPAILNSNIQGEKDIFHLYESNGLLYVSGTFGISVIDIDNRVVNETYTLNDGSENVTVYEIAENGQIILAATDKGIFQADFNNPDLFNFNNWQLHNIDQNILPGTVKSVKFFNGKFYCVYNNDVYEFENSEWQIFYDADNDWEIRYVEFNNNKMYTSELYTPNGSDRINVFENDAVVNTFENNKMYRPLDMEFINGNIWVSDQWAGLVKINETGSNDEIEIIAPNGPRDISVFDLVYNEVDNKMYCAAGSASASYNADVIGNDDGFYIFDNSSWTNFTKYSLYSDTIQDVITVDTHPLTGQPFFGTYIHGMFSYSNELGLKTYNPTNSTLGYHVNTQIRIGGIGFDNLGNLWAANYYSDKPIKLLTNEGEWFEFKPNISLPTEVLTEILVTSNNQIWITVFRKGILVYDPGENLQLEADDQWVFLNHLEGSGNLPDQEVFALAEDKDGEIWVGTKQGVGIFFCPNNIFSTNGCDAFQPIIDIDGFLTPLLDSDVISCIEVDDADRKWVGTGNGAWLLSEDGEEVVYNFTENNSPLLSNDIKDIAINNSNGEVFFGTGKGIISYRSTASEGQDRFENVSIFPNPVEPNFDGLITIKNLVDESNVKITDISGNLVYDTKALGGQVVWNGQDYTGRRVQTGVYLVLATNDDGSRAYEGKIMFLR